MRDGGMTAQFRRGSVVLSAVSGFVMGRAIVFMVLAGSLCSSVAFSQDAPPQNGAPQSDQPQNGQPQIAQPQNSSDDAFHATIGTWEFSNADHDKICRFNFRADAATGGHKLDIDKNCSNVFPSTKDITGWTVDNYGTLRLLDSGGNEVIELTEVEGGMYDGFQPGVGRYILQTAAAAPVHSADQMVGDWAIAHGTGKPICMLTLASNAGAANNLPLRIKPGCDALVSRFGPTSWHMENGELVLLSPRGQSWRFEENDANSWQRVPETPDPLLLIRQ
jgi:hypothetical protein